MSFLKKLFLCHSRDDADEVSALASVLRVRGVVPWVDQQGGFRLGHEQLTEARRAIIEDCFGLLLYATPKVFHSTFIRQVEIPSAIEAKDRDAQFVLAALPRDLGFGNLSSMSLEAFGFDFSQYASYHLGASGQENDADRLQRGFRTVANDLLRNRLIDARDHGSPGQLQFQYSTRERLADEQGDVLCVDASHLVAGQLDLSADAWRSLHEGLLDIKKAIANTYGRPKLRVHGTKHLTAAFLLGYVFPFTTFDMEVRTRQEYWSTSLQPRSDSLLEVEMRGGAAGSGALYVELSTIDQPLHEAVRRYIRRSQVAPHLTLRLDAPRLLTDRVMTNAIAASIAEQTKVEITKVVASRPVTEIHLFAAVPQALATMIGRRLSALPPVQLYEYDGREYHASYRLQGTSFTD